MIKSHLLAASSVLAIASISTVPALAQDTTDSSGVEQVIVSASRISIGGYTQPTPVTVVGADQLERDAQPDIADTIRQLPSFGTSSGPNTSHSANFIVSGTPGLNVVNLRQLGVLRTLVLFDGQRVVNSSVAGGVDLSTMPSSLVQRVDVVTGGASAAWGSDAVAGVVNVILNKNFTGFQTNLEFGDTFQDDHKTINAEASFGTGFDGNRGHVIASVAYKNNPDTFFINQRNWYHATRLVNNPAYNGGSNGQPRLIHANNVGISQATQGGLITAGPLKGIQFVGPNGTPAPFNFGNVSGSFSNGGDAETAQGDLDHLAIPLRTFTFFGYGSYRLTDNITASIELNYGKSHSQNNSYVANKFGSVTIYSDNAYLDPSIVASMANLGITSFKLGTTNENNIGNTGSHYINNSLAAEAKTLGIPVSNNDRQLFRGVFSLDGAIGDDWSWNAYYQHGLARARTTVINNVMKSRYNLAVDAVRVTTGNVGTSGLPVGSIVCRSSLADPTNGCQPLNVFGYGVASQAAISYINGPARHGHDYQLAVLNEDVFSASMQGQLPWGLAAGPVGIAFGGEYRKEGGRVTDDPLADAHAFSVGNFSAFAGSYNVKEGFVEVNAPLLKDSFVQSLDFNTAGRVTDYSTSGLVETWKVGLTSQVNEDVRLRTTWSYDIRAPNLQELYSVGFAILGNAVDPNTGQAVSIYNISAGNPNLDPEKAITISGGVVLTPHWVPGLSVSADWYSISIHGAIATLGSANVIAQCKAGVQADCAFLSFDGPNGALSQVINAPFNANSESTSGLDFQTDYQTDFMSGALHLRMIGNYTDQATRTDLNGTFDYAGSVGRDSKVAGVPKFKTTLSATYLEGPWSGTVQGRIIGSAKLNNAWGPLDVDDNSLPAVAYLDLRTSYQWNDNIQLYFAADNVINTPPPVVAGSSTYQGNPYTASIRDDIYDAFGRTFRIGFRLRY